MSKATVIVGYCKHERAVAFCSMLATQEARLDFVNDPLLVRLEKTTQASVAICPDCKRENDVVAVAAKHGCRFVADPEWGGTPCHAKCDEGQALCPRHTLLVANLTLVKAQKHERVEAKLRAAEGEVSA